VLGVCIAVYAPAFGAETVDGLQRMKSVFYRFLFFEASDGLHCGTSFFVLLGSRMLSPRTPFLPQRKTPTARVVLAVYRVHGCVLGSFS